MLATETSKTQKAIHIKLQLELSCRNNIWKKRDASLTTVLKNCVSEPPRSLWTGNAFSRSSQTCKQLPLSLDAATTKESASSRITHLRWLTVLLLSLQISSTKTNSLLKLSTFHDIISYLCYLSSLPVRRNLVETGLLSHTCRRPFVQTLCSTELASRHLRYWQSIRSGHLQNSDFTFFSFLIGKAEQLNTISYKMKRISVRLAENKHSFFPYLHQDIIYNL